MRVLLKSLQLPTNWQNQSKIHAETAIVEIARVSSSRQDKTENPEPLIKYLIENKHWSPFEMVNMCVEITTSRAISVQFLRHRSFSFQEFSQRYAAVTAFEPIELRQQAANNRQSSTDAFDPEIYYGDKPMLASEAIARHQQATEFLYSELLDANVAKECARFILPQCAETTLFMNGSVRSWIHFLQLRDEGHAQKEARDIAVAIKEIFKTSFPIISKSMGWL